VRDALVDNARRAHAQGEIHWSALLVGRLEMIRRGLGFERAFDIILRLRDRFGIQGDDAAALRLAALGRVIAAGALPVEIQKHMEAIWPTVGRSDFDRTVYRLYSALRYRLQDNQHYYELELAAAIGLACMDGRFAPEEVEGDLSELTQGPEPQQESHDWTVDRSSTGGIAD